VIVKGDVQVDGGRRTGCLRKTHSLIMRDVSVDKKRKKITVKKFSRRDCIRKFSYHETLLHHSCSEEIPK
jgi:hypothetical protein